jgi:hypothetical protein
VAELSRRARLALTVQLAAGRLLAPLWVPLSAALMRFGMGWRVEGVERSRAEYRRIRAASREPLLICANHLTMVDSALVAWALGSPVWYLLHPAALPWNLPDREHFASSWWARVLVYVMKCLPIPRGGDRGEVSGVLARAGWLLRHGEAALVFPEGGRSRSGRVEQDSQTWGVGRLLGAVPGCRVLCVYLRGERQQTFSRMPARGERFRVRLALFEPKSTASGLRRSLDLSRQVLGRLAALEEEHVRDRG